MSAGLELPITAVVVRRLDVLAPRFADAVEAAMDRATDAGLDPYIFETYRSDALQQLYYARGRTVRPPARPVTNARSNLYSWHGYGLAVDVIHRTRYWDVPETWYVEVAEHFKREGCKWGGDWQQRDLPHVQWGKCRASPSDRARELIATQGLAAVWDAVGAA